MAHFHIEVSQPDVTFDWIGAKIVRLRWTVGSLNVRHVGYEISAENVDMIFLIFDGANGF